MLPQDIICIKGDTIDLQFQLYKDKCTNEYWNLTDNEIRFQLNTTPKIYKATANVTGGSSDQISIINASQGIFLISITSTESTDIAVGDYTFEIQVTTAQGGKYTVLQGSLRIVNESIAWGDVPDEV